MFSACRSATSKRQPSANGIMLFAFTKLRLLLPGESRLLCHVCMKVMIQFCDVIKHADRCCVNGDYNPLSRVGESFVAGFCAHRSNIRMIIVEMLASLFYFSRKTLGVDAQQQAGECLCFQFRILSDDSREVKMNAIKKSPYRSAHK